MNRLLAVPLLLIIVATGTAPQNLPESQQKIKQSVESRQYPVAITELQKLQAEDTKLFTANNYDYLLARMAESDGQLGLAMASYHAVAARNSPLAAWAQMHMSQIARSTGNLMLERLYLEEIRLMSPDSLLANSATLRLAKNSFERANYAETIRILTSGAGTGKSAGARENQALLAEAYLRHGETDRAREIFTGLINSIPNQAQPDDVALTAVKNLDLLAVGSENLGKKVPNLTEVEQFQRGNIYQFNRDFADAKLHFEALIANFPAGANSADAAFQIGRGFAQQSDYVHALEWFERVIERYAASNAAKDSLLQVAAAYGRVGKHKESIKRYQTFIDKYPTDEKLDRAYLNIVDILRDQGEDTDALKWTAKTQETFRGKLPEAVALFAEARIYIAREDWQNALTDLDKLARFKDLGGATVPGGTTAVEIAFLKAYTLEQLQKYPEAIDMYLSIPDGRNEYYGWRATERLRLLSNVDSAKVYVEEAINKDLASTNEKVSANMAVRRLQDENKRVAAQRIYRLTSDPKLAREMKLILLGAYWSLPDYQYIKGISFSGGRARQCYPLDNNPNDGAINPNFSQTLYGRCELRYEDRPYEPKRKGHFVIVEELIFLGLYDEAAPELAFALGVKDSFANLSSEDALALAWAFKSGDMADKAIAFAEPFWRKVPSDYLVELAPRDAIEMLYPAPYADSILRYAREKNVDPRLMLAIMRQESRFQPDAKSYAAARGLMQFISTTSTKVAGELGRNAFEQDDLYYPPTAILFGSQYLADLFKSFPNQPDAVTASYNGGDDNMKRWLARSRSNLPERYVPEILYAQSKDYVYKVMANYRMYQYMYDENLRPTGPQASLLAR